MELVAGARLPERTFGPVTLTEVPVPGVLYLVISGAPAPEGLPSLVTLLQKYGWRDAPG